jgi:hypothetical protein
MAPVLGQALQIPDVQKHFEEFEAAVTELRERLLPAV